MAKPKANRKRTRGSSSDKEGARSTGRRQEILGVLIFILGIFIAVSGITYSASDDLVIEGKAFWELFFPMDTEVISNAIGPIGAWLAYMIVPSFFGYTSLLLCVILFMYGYLILRKKSFRSPLTATIHIVWMVVLLATLLGRISISSQIDLHIWAGQTGMFVANWLYSTLGWFGSWLVLTMVSIIGGMSLIDRDIQSWFDRAEQSWLSMMKALKEKRSIPPESQNDNTVQTTWDDLEKTVSPPSEETDMSPSNQEFDAPPAEPTLAEELEPNAKLPPHPSIKVQSSSAPSTKRSISTPEPDPTDLELKVTEQITEETASGSSSRSSKLEDGYNYQYPHSELLDAPTHKEQEIDYNELEENKTKLVEKLARYKIEIIGVNATVGPTVTLYELTPAPGVKVSRIKSLEDDLAMVMAAQGIRMIVPIPGKSAVGVEIPNSRRELVRVQSVLNTARFQESNMQLPVVLGKSIEGEVFLQDLTKMPHLLIAGATGSGKSVGLNTLITGLLYACEPSNLKFVMVDPKKIELQQYRELRDHFLAMPDDGDEAIITEVSDALDILRACEREMSIRYDLLKEAGVRGISDYNSRFSNGTLDPDNGHKHLPYIVIIIDELADLMMTAGKDVEAPIARLAQMARAVGIHLILATQRPSVDVITGLIKANFPARVAFQVASKVDARTILDQNGAEQLVGNGDMLYMKGSKIIRLQGPFVSVDEIDRIMDYIQNQPGAGPYRLPAVESEPELTVTDPSSNNGSTDELFEEAARIIVRHQQGSVSLIQRKLSIGYTRAARIVDQLEEAGIVGAFSGAKAREVLVPDEVYLEKILNS